MDTISDLLACGAAWRWMRNIGGGAAFIQSSSTLI
jgi:hypothetical protein